MAQIPKKVSERMSENLRKFQPILASARDRDVNEANTVVIVTDMLSEVFGYDKYSEITTEHNIRGTFCDLAIIVENDIRFIIEVKAIGIDLKDTHVRQATDYAANKGVDWAILTNGDIWRVYRVLFNKPIEQELIIEFSMLKLNPKNIADLDALFLLAREGLNKSALSEYQTQLQATNRFTLAAAILSEPVLKVIRKALRKTSPEISVSIEDIKGCLIKEVLKREVVEGDQANDAKKKIGKALKKVKRAKSSEPGEQTPPATDAVDESEENGLDDEMENEENLTHEEGKNNK